MSARSGVRADGIPRGEDRRSRRRKKAEKRGAGIERIDVHFPAQEKDDVRRAARKLGLSMSAFATQLITDGVKEILGEEEPEATTVAEPK